MRFDKWFNYFWTINLSFLALSLASSAFYVFVGNQVPLEGLVKDPFNTLGIFPAPVVFLFFLPFFISGYVLLAMGIIEVYTSKKPARSKLMWILPMLAIGTMVTVVYFFVRGRDQLSD